MKDSHIGVYGVIAVALGIGLRWQALTLIFAAGLVWPALIVVACLSRAVMVPVMARLPHARSTGLSHAVGRPSQNTALISLGIAALLAVILWQGVGIWLLMLAALATLICAIIAKRKIGGQTGDILGATQQITEITLLLAIAARLS